ncbi:MAG: DUF1015 domain-containing protein [Rhodothermales bacterium]|nr:DUF1015 domain-containing protein [Rhodothermales bacterium]MBO6779688.1 DUF1015 domain-containing protein [Rhodothermales bacterium]
MAHLHPFKAVRPTAEAASDVASVPYDVINGEEARELAKGNARSFLHVIRPEIDLPEGTDEHADEVYARGAANLKAFASADYTVEDPQPSLYLYRLIMKGRSQTGIFGCVSVADYDNDVILKHELTRPKKEDDRTRHIVEQSAHAEPVMLTFKDDDAVAGLMSDCARQDPVYDFVAPDGVQHTIWRFSNPDAVVSAFQGIDNLYVADGHHRCKAASRAAAELGAGPSDEASYFPAVLFPMAEMHIMAYNRIVRTLPVPPAQFLAQLEVRFGLRPDASPTPMRRGDIALYVDGAWFGMTLPHTEGTSASDRLDVGRLTEHILEPMLGITDPRRDPNIDFVGGIRGTQELERLVDSGRAALGISMYPTSIEELVDVSDAGLLMPPKSTWFEPKLRSGLLVHRF